MREIGIEFLEVMNFCSDLVWWSANMGVPFIRNFQTNFSVGIKKKQVNSIYFTINHRKYVKLLISGKFLKIHPKIEDA